MGKVKNTKAKGSRHENELIKYYESIGYYVTRAAGSKGTFDIHVEQLFVPRNQYKGSWGDIFLDDNTPWDWGETLLPNNGYIQVKTSGLPDTEELRAIISTNFYNTATVKMIAVRKTGGYFEFYEVEDARKSINGTQRKTLLESYVSKIPVILRVRKPKKQPIQFELEWLENEEGEVE
jgi:hypothetical protein